MALYMGIPGDTWDGSGRFAAAATAGPAVTASPLTVSADEDFPRWLSASVDSAPVEVNVNLGQLQFRQHNVTAVPREVMELPEFQEVFPNVEVNSCLLWALVEKAKQRERYRFAGLRYEFHLWKLDQTLPEIPYSRRFPQHATAKEAVVHKGWNVGQPLLWSILISMLCFHLAKTDEVSDEGPNTSRSFQRYYCAFIGISMLCNHVEGHGKFYRWFHASGIEPSKKRGLGHAGKKFYGLIQEEMASTWLSLVTSLQSADPQENHSVNKNHCLFLQWDV
eukprot:symbB.v1.2.031434.t1/scaffold3648.1/size52728/3